MGSYIEPAPRVGVLNRLETLVLPGTNRRAAALDGRGSSLLGAILLNLLLDFATDDRPDGGNCGRRDVAIADVLPISPGWLSVLNKVC